MSASSSRDDLRALAHPVRYRMLSLLSDRAMSAGEVGKLLDISQPSASYHLRRLYEVGLIEVEAEVKVRGGMAKLYRYRLPDADHGAVAQGNDPSARVQQLRGLIGDLERRTLARSTGFYLVADLEGSTSQAAWDLFRTSADRLLRDLHGELRPAGEAECAISVSLIAFDNETRGKGE